MTPEQEDQLLRVLKLKRYEQPPPGYFNRFSREVMARIRTAEAEKYASAMERLYRKAPWLQPLLAAFEVKPFMAGTFGALVCALLISGIIYSERMESAPVAVAPASADTAMAATLASPPLALSQPGAEAMLVSSTNPVTPTGSLFDHISLPVQNVSGHPPFGN